MRRNGCELRKYVEVVALLVLDTDDEGDKVMGTDSKGDLLLSPPAGI